jgi:hypothetical protein
MIDGSIDADGTEKARTPDTEAYSLRLSEMHPDLQ